MMRASPRGVSAFGGRDVRTISALVTSVQERPGEIFVAARLHFSTITHVPKKADIWVQLATRVPASLLQRVKIHCVEREVSVMGFVAHAIREKLRPAGIRNI